MCWGRVTSDVGCRGSKYEHQSLVGACKAPLSLSRGSLKVFVLGVLYDWWVLFGGREIHGEMREW